jgi:hypothetical protein
VTTSNVGLPLSRNASANLRRASVAAIGVVGALAAIAWISPDPGRVTDRATYEASAALMIVPDCSDLQCFRVLVPWVLGRLPGSSILRWKAYAVAANAAAAAGVWALCLTFGCSRRAAVLASMLSALGFGSLYTLHDPFTSDPLMFALGPIMTAQLLSGRLALAAVIGVVGVTAKEFAAAPLYAFALYEAAARRWLTALRAAAAGNLALIAWALLTLTLMLKFGYAWGWNGVGSADVTRGAALALWAGRQSGRGIAFAMFNEFGALYALAPAGLALASTALRRLAFVSLPIAGVFAYVQQPDRGLWNFHYLVTPLAALVLERVPPLLAASTVAAFAIGNLRVGAQLPIAGVARLAIAASVLLALVCVGVAFRVVPDSAAHRTETRAAVR